ncbi:hypothetical protein JOD54_000867 [Actinokineospora baliensis]|uniref:hypothetical protein n=1 Tax=Actinokineospora baliensis TaxID=547056 RepID=UPI00195EA712|nr:hypothetical protein [Actinokineospora baliensis]MBM7770663.1 hypothetical protein [Actinokineospora baliensis]
MPSCCDDVVLVHWADADRGARQSADALLAEHDDQAEGLRWVSRTLGEFPGCTVAATRDPGGRWLVSTLKLHNGRPLWMFLRGSVDKATAAGAVRLLCSLAAEVGG